MSGLLHEHVPARTAVEQGADTRRFWRVGGGYSLQQSTRPQTVGYTLVDSPWPS